MLKEPFDLAFAISDYFRNMGEGDRYSKFTSDLGSVKSPEEAAALRRSIAAYEFTNPNVAVKANDDINQWLDKYSAANKFSAEQADNRVAQDAITNTANLYGRWRRENPYAGQSQFFDQYASAVEGPPAIDPRALMLDPYKKGFDILSGGLSESENRSITSKREAEKLAGQEALKAKYANRPAGTNTLDNFNNLVTDMYATPNAPLDDIRNIITDYVARNSGPVSTGQTVSQVGPETSKNVYGTDFLGRYVTGTSATANDNPAGRELQREQLRQGKAKEKEPKYYTFEYEDGTIEQFDVSKPTERAKLDGLRSSGLGVVSRTDNPESQQTYVTDSDGNEKSVTKKVRKPVKNRKIVLPNTPQVQAAKAAGYTDAEIEAYLKQQRK